MIDYQIGPRSRPLWDRHRRHQVIDWGVEWELRVSAATGSRVCQDCRAVVTVRYVAGALEEVHECDPDAVWAEAERRGRLKRWLRLNHAKRTSIGLLEHNAQKRQDARGDAPR